MDNDLLLNKTLQRVLICLNMFKYDTFFSRFAAISGAARGCFVLGHTGAN